MNWTASFMPFFRILKPATAPAADAARFVAVLEEEILVAPLFVFRIDRVTEGREGIGAVREVTRDHIVIYVENGGEFEACCPLHSAASSAVCSSTISASRSITWVPSLATWYSRPVNATMPVRP